MTNAAVAAQSTKGTDDFVTGLVGQLDLRTGALDLVNAGHVPPFLVREGVTTLVDLAVDLPFGVFPETGYSTTRLDLQPGDRLVLVTDGMLERKVSSLDLSGALSTTRDLHPREVVRALADRALEATGHALSDDATVLCLDWHGRHDRPRTSRSGADQARASGPLDQDRASTQAS
jgi:serine phosphatase RsbU (regulator of sigma subunit)